MGLDLRLRGVFANMFTVSDRMEGDWYFKD